MTTRMVDLVDFERACEITGLGHDDLLVAVNNGRIETYRIDCELRFSSGDLFALATTSHERSS